ncbi:MAG: hypothetical protein ACP6IS_07260 [Candidatus Asgardarchaeia archaeon]
MKIKVGCILIDEQRRRVFLISAKGNLEFPLFDQEASQTLEEILRENFLNRFGLEIYPEKLIYTISSTSGNGVPELHYYYLAKLKNVVSKQQCKECVWLSFDELSKHKIQPSIVKQFLLEDIEEQDFHIRFGRIS